VLKEMAEGIGVENLDSVSLTANKVLALQRC